MSAKAKQRVLLDELLVPVRGSGEAWEWVEPATAYLGEGWGDDVNIQLLTKAFGNRPSSQLVSWQRFEKKAVHLFRSADRDWWAQRMMEIGVWDCPRILQTDRRILVAQSDSYAELTPHTWVRCPMPCSDELWKNYLTAVCKRPANTKSGQEFYLKNVVWIDGLENDAIRETVVEAILRNAARYETYVATQICRWEGDDSKDIANLWIYAMRVSAWAVVPTSHGTAQTKRLLVSPVGSKRGEIAALLIPPVREG